MFKELINLLIDHQWQFEVFYKDEAYCEGYAVSFIYTNDNPIIEANDTEKIKEYIELIKNH